MEKFRSGIWVKLPGSEILLSSYLKLLSLLYFIFCDRRKIRTVVLCLSPQRNDTELYSFSTPFIFPLVFRRRRCKSVGILAV
jgi:hypothetical protein